MTIRELAAALKARIAQDDFDDVKLNGAYTSDLLSDVIANAKDGGVLITIQAHKNTVAVATLVNIRCIIICNKRPLPEDMLKSARDEGVAVLHTNESQFTVSGKVWEIFHKSCR